MRTSLKGLSFIIAEREAIGLGSAMRSSQILLGMAARTRKPRIIASGAAL
jgi:hypothetical protein